uniref:Uncharacterized protein n=1 Tax=Hemiarma marina TaxID=1848298 RepID=A0A679EJR5_9CRYP|nr:hypothetical protein [Hemiarma marina]
MFNRFFIFLGFALVGIVTVSWFEFDAAWWEPVSEATSVAERFELGYKSGGSERWRFPAFFEKNVEELGPMGMFLWADTVEKDWGFALAEEIRYQTQLMWDQK